MESSPKGYTYKTTPEHKAQETLPIRGWKVCKTQ